MGNVNANVYFVNPFAKGSFGSYFAGYAADGQKVEMLRTGKKGPIQITHEKLANNPTEDEMVADFASRQRATFSDPREKRTYGGRDVCEILAELSGNQNLADGVSLVTNAQKALSEAFAALDRLKDHTANQLTNQLVELERAADAGNECLNNVAKCFNLCSDAADAIMELYNRTSLPQVVTDVNLLSCLDELQERLSAVPTQLGRIIESFSPDEGERKLPDILTARNAVGVGNQVKANVKNFMTEIAAIAKEIDGLGDKAGDERVQTVADTVQGHVNAALRQLEENPLPSAELTRTFKEKLEGLNRRLTERNEALENLGLGRFNLLPCAKQNLGSADFLRRIFGDDQFSVSWYVTVLSNHISEKVIDMRYAPDKMTNPNVNRNNGDKLGEGWYNEVYKVGFKGTGSILGPHDMVSKDLQHIKERLVEERSRSNSNLSFLGVDPSKVLYTNYSSWSSSYKMTGTCPIVSCTIGQVPSGGGEEGKNLSILMEKAPGKPLCDAKWVLSKDGEKFFKKLEDRDKIQLVGQILEQGSDLDISDWFSGQIDRHMGNLMINLAREETGKVSVTLRGIDNDLSFMANRTGLRRIRLSEQEFMALRERWNGVKTSNEYRQAWKYENISTGDKNVKDKEVAKRIAKEAKWIKATTINGKKHYEMDLDLAPDDYKGGFRLGFMMNSCRKPSFVSRKTYDKVMALDKEIKSLGELSGDALRRRQREILGISPQIGDEALSAALSRFNEIVAHLKVLKNEDRVISDFTNVKSVTKAFFACVKSVAVQTQVGEGDAGMESDKMSVTQKEIAKQMADSGWKVLSNLGIDVAKALKDYEKKGAKKA